MYVGFFSYTYKDQNYFVKEDHYASSFANLARNIFSNLPDDDTVIAELIKGYNGFLDIMPLNYCTYQNIITPFNVLYALISHKYKQLPDKFEVKYAKEKLYINYNQSFILNVYAYIALLLETGIQQMKKIMNPPKPKPMSDVKDKEGRIFGFKIVPGLMHDELFYPIQTNQNFVTAATDKAAIYNLDFDKTSVAFQITLGFFNINGTLELEISESAVFVTNYTLNNALKLAIFRIPTKTLVASIFENGYIPIKVDELRSKQIDLVTKLVFS